MSWQNTQYDKKEQEHTKHSSYLKRFTARLYNLSLTLAASIEGLEDATTRHRYASLLIHRLLYIYTLQQAGLLSEDRDCLQHQLDACKACGGFYRSFLRPLFAGGEPHVHISFSPNGLFCSHEIEDAYAEIRIADDFFVCLFALFEEYMDQERESVRGATLPELLEQLGEQNMPPREMGTYYTPRAVTTYIVRNTLPAALLARTRTHCTEACSLDLLLWRKFVEEPLRYIYAMVCQGYNEPLPPEIAAGLTDVTRRGLWQQFAPAAYAHPGETWREALARRERVDEILRATRQEAPATLEQLTTWNVNVPALLLDSLRSCQHADLLIACYQSLRQLSVLDPTCGTGAFLCAALPLLQDLYVACLARMDEWYGFAENEPELSSAQRRLFQHFLEEAGPPAVRVQNCLQWIIAHNLYGVDLHEEVVEICRLRLCLKLLMTCPASRLPMLPETFAAHIRVGNSLLGSLCPSSSLTSSAQYPHVKTQEIPAKPTRYQRVFHWQQAFPEPMKRGGFDVVIGNPPYVEYERVRPFYTVEGYTTLETGNLYALTMERALHLLAPGGSFGMIVPSSATCANGYRSLQKLLLEQQELHIASFSDQRGHLFDLPHPRLCIIISTGIPSASSQPGRVFTTPYMKLGKGAPAGLFEHLSYIEITPRLRAGSIPRYGSPLELAIEDKLAHQPCALGTYHQRRGDHPIYFTRKLSWYVQATPFIPRILDAQGQLRLPSELKNMRFSSPVYARMAFAALNSNLFYWLITTGSDCRNLNMREVLGLPLDLASIQPAIQQELCHLADKLEHDLLKHARMKPMVFQKHGRLTIQCLYPARSKHLIDDIDRALARHYMFDEQELDFLLHYDGKYRQTTRCSG